MSGSGTKPPIRAARRPRRPKGAAAPRQRADGLWEVRFYVRDPDSGLKRVSAYGKTKEVALSSKESRLKAAATRKPTRNGTVGAWLDNWSRTTWGVSYIPDSQCHRARALTKTFLSDGWLSRTRLGDLDVSAVERFAQELANELAGDPATPSSSVVADATTRSVLSVLQAGIDTAVRDGVLPINPVRAVHQARYGVTDW